MPDIQIRIGGMHCASCVGRVERALSGMPGVTSATVNLATETARVGYEAPADPGAIAERIREQGYSVAQTTARLEVEGMHCGSCVGRIERALSSLPGVTLAEANLATGTARATYLEGTATPAGLVTALREAGFTAHPHHPPSDRGNEGHPPDAHRHDAAPAMHDHHHGSEDALKQRLIVAALLTLPVFMLEMGGHVFTPFHHWIMATLGQQASYLLQFVLATLVLIGPGREFFRVGLPALWRGRPEMNSLVALGALAAWAFSTTVTFAPALVPEASRHVYFEAAAVIVTLILLGRWLEARARGRAGQAIGRLVALQVPVARRLTPTGPQDVAVESLVPGDLILVRPGERVATDGEVTEGRSWVDEAMLTGEPAPVAKEPGSALTGGAVNGSAGALTFRVTRVGAQTTLARIIALVEEAQAGKLPIQALVDRVTMWFVPAVIGIAMLTFLVWAVLGPSLSQAVAAAVAVLIIACPCAMGLATPVSILVGTGRGAELGLLFRRGEALQRMEGASVVAFDKTGTLTEGKPRLTDLLTLRDPAEMLRIAASVEARSEHPIAHALAEAAKADGLVLSPVEDFTVHSGRGLSARVDGHDVLIGSLAFVMEQGADPADAAADVAHLGSAGRSPVVLAIDGRAEAVIAVADRVKADAARTVAALKARGLQVAMVTGDNASAAGVIAAELGITAVEAEVLPDGKVEAVRRLRERFGPVAFVGDGINDAPALAEADLGIAIGSGTDVAIEAADVVLISGDPAGVVRVLDLSRATMRNIRQNLFWAFAYNVVLIPVAAGALYPLGGPMLSPPLAAGAMALSSVFVVTNALRLRKVGRRPDPSGSVTLKEAHA